MKKSRLLEYFRVFNNSALIERKTIAIDIAEQCNILLLHKNKDIKEECIRLPPNTFESVINGQIQNIGKFLNDLSFVNNIYIQNKMTSFALIKKKVLLLITRQELSNLQKNITQNATAQIPYDECIFLSHKKIFAEYLIKKFGDAYKNEVFYRFYDNEIYIDRAVGESQNLNLHPQLFAFALKEFIENKYVVMIETESMNKLLDEHFKINPKTVGKKNIKFKIPVLDLNNNQKYIEPSYSEVSEAIRPISKAMLYKLQSFTSRLNQNEFYFFSSINWFRRFLAVNEQSSKVRFIDIGDENGQFFIDQSITASH